MTETLFYHLERRSLEDVLPGLIEKTLERGWRAVIRCESAERAEAVDALLWTYDDASFLPHAQAGDGDTAHQPVLITVEDTNANAANVMFVVGGAAPPVWNAASCRPHGAGDPLFSCCIDDTLPPRSPTYAGRLCCGG